MELHYLSLLEVSDLIRRREVSSLEVTSALLARIERHEPRLNAILMLLADQALDAARQADGEMAAGQWRGPLHGVPLGIKDLHWTKDLPTTGGMALLRDFRPPEDASVVARLKRAGAVILAKLHMTEGALIDHHPVFARPSNPWSEDDMAETNGMFGAEALAAHVGMFPENAESYGPRTLAMFESYGNLDAASVARGYQARDRMKGKMAAMFREVDLLLLPGLGKLLPRWDEIDAMFGNLDDTRKILLRFNSPFNLTGVPTISLPAGFTEGELPFGIQLVGPWLAEPVLIRAGAAFQRATDHHTRHPALD